MIYGDRFRAGMGAEAVNSYRIDLDENVEELRAELKGSYKVEEVHIIKN